MLSPNLLFRKKRPLALFREFQTNDRSDYLRPDDLFELPPKQTLVAPMPRQVGVSQLVCVLKRDSLLLTLALLAILGCLRIATMNLTLAASMPQAVGVGRHVVCLLKCDSLLLTLPLLIPNLACSSSANFYDHNDYDDNSN